MCVSSSPGKPQKSHGRYTKKKTGWGQGLVPAVAGGSSRKKDKFRHSLYLAPWPGQTASQMQTVGSWCDGFTKLREEISWELSFPSGSPHGGSSLALPYSSLGHARLPFINHGPAVRARKNILSAVQWTAPGPRKRTLLIDRQTPPCSWMENIKILPPDLQKYS